MSYRLPSLGQSPSPPTTPPPAPVPWNAVAGWAALVAVTAGFFYAVSYRPRKSVSKNKRSRRTSKVSFGMTKPRISWDYDPFSTGSQVSTWVTPNALTDAQRAKLPLSVFVFPERRAWPLDKASRAYDAIRMMRLGRVRSAADFNKLRNAIRTRFPQVWAEYGKTLTWDRVKRAKGKARTSRAATIARKHRRSSVRRMAANMSGSGSMSPEAKKLLDLALKEPLTYEDCSRADAIVLSITKPSERSRAVEFVQKFMWNKLPPSELARALGGSEKPKARKTSAKKTKTEVKVETKPAVKRSSSKKADKPKFSELDALTAVGVVRSSTTPKKGDVLPPGVMAKFKNLPAGIYKYGWGAKKGEVIQKFGKASLKGAIMSTRIGAKYSGEYHWVVDNYDPSFPVVIRGIDNNGKTFFRVEEFARQFISEPVRVTVAKSKSAGR